ncbi:MAG: NADH-quinone oxidoreductase subunit K [Endomicrobiaceae bacterium]
MSLENILLFKLYIITMPILFLIGIYAIMTTRNIIATIIGIEIMTKGVTLLLAACGYFNGRPEMAQSFIIIMIVIEVVILTISAGLIFNIVKKHDSLDTRNIRNLKG